MEEDIPIWRTYTVCVVDWYRLGRPGGRQDCPATPRRNSAATRQVRAPRTTWWPVALRQTAADRAMPARRLINRRLWSLLRRHRRCSVGRAPCRRHLPPNVTRQHQLTHNIEHRAAGHSSLCSVFKDQQITLLNVTEPGRNTFNGDHK